MRLGGWFCTKDSIGTASGYLLLGFHGRPGLRAFAVKAGFDVVGVCKETASGPKDDRTQRKKVMALALARDVDVVLGLS